MSTPQIRVAILAPLVESVPPPLYGGTERVVSVLTEELVRRGHDVTLFASGDSHTSARLVATTERSLRLDRGVRDYVAATFAHAEHAYRHAHEFDIIHNHVDYVAWPFARVSPTPTVSTPHGRLDLLEIQRLYRAFPEQPLVSISMAQRGYIPELNWVANVYNAIDLENYHFQPDIGDYLVFLGRISPEKRPDRAIEIARDVGMPLIIAAKVDSADREYWEHAIEPLVRSSSLIEYIGEVNEKEKDTLLGGAYAYIFPIDWPEPFGLTMVESMATGTPVITFGTGSTPEVVVDGETGFVCNSMREMFQAVANVERLDRRACRRHVERCFSPETMAAGYESIYAAMLCRGAEADPRPFEDAIEPGHLIPEPPVTPHRVLGGPDPTQPGLESPTLSAISGSV